MKPEILQNRMSPSKGADKWTTKTHVRSAGQQKPLLRVLVIAPSFDIVGGQSVQAARLIEGLSAEPSLEIGFLPINPRLPGVWRKLQSVKYLRTIVTSLRYIASLLARVGGYDIIHIFSAAYYSFVLAPTPAILVSKLYGKKVVLNYHSGEAEDHLAEWRRTAIPTIRLADTTVVQSKYLVEVFARFGLPARAIFNHLETDKFRFRVRSPLRPVFLSNRNLEPKYNVGCVLRAFALVQKKFVDARLLIVGDGSQRAELEALARSLGLRETQFVGQVAPEEMRACYDAADILLNGSEIDNMPLSILEAYASGLPLVTTDAGGIPHIVRHEETGLMVQCGDHEAIAAGAARLLEEPSLAFRLAQNGRAECEKYSWSAVRDEWLRLYCELAGKSAVMKFVEDTKRGTPLHADEPVMSDEERALSREQGVVGG